MIKRKIAIVIMLMFSIMMLAHSIIIHHHHHESLDFDSSLHYEDGVVHSHDEEFDVHDYHHYENEQGLPINLHTGHDFPCHSHFSPASEFYFTLRSSTNALKKIHNFKYTFFNRTNQFEFFSRHESKNNNLELVFLISFQFQNESITLRGPPIV